MGIPGLTTLIDENLHLLDDFKLHHSKVIIDGNNLLHLLFYNYNIDFTHGGDYNKFYRRIKEFFGILKSCDIEPYIILDGGYEPDDRKLKTVLDRAKNRIHLASFIAYEKCGKILPILSYEVFISALDDLGIHHVTCDFEADNQIAVLANDFKCPVISFDSDFYILNVEHGFIPFDSVNFEVQPIAADDEGRQFKYLPVKIYFTQNFISCFPVLDKRVLPLMATVLGNDYVHIKNFEEFYSSLRTPKHLQSSITVSRTRTKMLKVVHWLGNLKSVESGVLSLVMSVKPENRDKVRSLIDKSMEAYTNVAGYSSFNLYQFFTNKNDCIESKSINSYNDRFVQEWFVKFHRQSKMAVFMQNTLVLHRNILLCQVEDMKLLSSYNPSLRLRRVLYGILLKSELEAVERTETLSKDCCVEEYERQDCTKNLKKTLVEPVFTLDGYGPIPSLCDLELLKVNEKRSLMFTLLDVTLKENTKMFTDDNLLFLMTMIYWIRNSNPKVNMFMVQTLIICWILLSLKSYADDIEQRDDEMSKLFCKASSQQRERVRKNLEKYLAVPQHNKRHPLDIDILHGFAQFQTCLLTVIHLNQVLDLPFSVINPATFLNGSFLYSFYKDLLTRPKPELFIAEMLVKQSPILDYFQKLVLLLSSQVDECILSTSCTSGHKKSRQRKKKNEATDSTSVSVSDGESARKSPKKTTGKQNMRAECVLSNRFNFLEVEDSD